MSDHAIHSRPDQELFCEKEYPIIAVKVHDIIADEGIKTIDNLIKFKKVQLNR